MKSKGAAAMKDSPFRSKEQKQAERALYEAIGEFAVAFERIFGALRMACVIMLQRRGLTCQPLADVLLARRRDKELKELAGAMYAEFRPDDEVGQKELASLLAKIGNLTTQRNDYLHAVWTMSTRENNGTLDWSAFAVVLDKTLKKGRTVAYL